MSRTLSLSERLVFTGDGVGDGVLTRNKERYDLVKIKLTESEAVFKTDCDMPLSLIIVIGSINQSKCSNLGLVIGLFFRLCIQLRQCSFQWIVSEGIISRIGRKWKREMQVDFLYSLSQL